MKNLWPKIKEFLVRNKRILLLLFLYFNVFILISTLVIIIRTRPAGEVKVPSVVGNKFSFVYNSLERSGLKPELKFTDVYDIEDGIILNQHPEAGKSVPKGNRIILTVSRNDLDVEVPSLVGAGINVVRNKLSSLHSGDRTVTLLTGVISYLPSDKTAENVVIMQSPGAGEKVKPYQKVNLLVSSGPATADAKMPDITNQSIDLVYDLLLSKGVTVEQEIVNTSVKEESGRILGSVPAAGELLKSGDVVKLKVAYFPAQEQLYGGYEKVTYEMKKGKLAYCEAYVEDDGGKRICFAANIPGEKEISFVFYRQGNARISIVRNKKIVTVMSFNVTRF